MKKLYSPLKIIFFGVLLVSLSLNLKAQEECKYILEKAEALFEQGIIEEIPGMLSECMEEGFSPEEKMRAQKLVILSYFFDKKTAEAEEVMLRFLRNNPEYEIQPSDPAEFVRLFSAFETFPVLSVGTSAGGNLASPGIIKPYGPYNINESGADFSFSEAGYQFGAGVNFYLINNIELSLEATYIKNSFLYSNTQYGFSVISIKETHEKLELPVLFKYVFPQDQWSPYVSLGASYGYVINAKANYKRSYSESVNLDFEPVVNQGVDLEKIRKTHAWSGIIGGGIRYRIPRGYFFLDIRHFAGLTNTVNSDNRWEQESVFTHYHTDSDFRVNYFSLSIGVRYIFYNSRKK